MLCVPYIQHGLHNLLASSGVGFAFIPYSVEIDSEYGFALKSPITTM